MFKNYLIATIRNALKSRLYTIINLLGLTVGLTAFVMILLYVNYERSYDAFLPDSDRLYRFETRITPPGLEGFHTAESTGAGKGVLEFTLPGVTEINRLVYRGTSVRRGETLFTEEVMHTDGNFFDLFQLEFIEGDPATALLDESSIVISSDIARKYFGGEPALGETLTLNGSRDFTVSGVVENLPDNSHLEFDMAVLFDPANFSREFTESWSNTLVYSYLKLAAGAAIEPVEAMLPDLVNQYILPDVRAGGFDVDDANEIMRWNLIPVKDIHLYGAGGNSVKPGGSPISVVAFLLIAVLVLVLATINYTNLALARSLMREREVGLRKVLGAKRRQIIVQFLVDSALMVGLSLGAALMASGGLLPIFNEYLDADLSLLQFLSPLSILSLAAAMVTAWLLAGFYPSVYASAIRPSRVLAAKRSTSKGGGVILRQALVVLQFSIAIALVIGMTIIYQQTNYARSLDPGFERDGILVLRNIDNPNVFPAAEALKRRLMAAPGIPYVTTAIDVPTDDLVNGTRFDIQTPELPQGLVLELHSVDQDFFHTFGIEPVAGRVFGEEYGQDLMRDYFDTGFANGSVVVNVEATRRLGFATPDEAIGQTYRMVGEFLTEPVWVEGTIVGVVRDFYYRGVKEAIGPVVFNVDKRVARAMAIRFETRNLPATVEYVDRVWAEMFPNQPITREFMDENMDLLYKSDTRDGEMMAAFSILAILLAALGLFGLAALSTEQRTKEVGIRKVLGASIADIVKLLVWQFSRPVILANLIAWPVACYFAHDWLSGFVERISVSPLIFLSAGVAALLVAWVTVFAHAFRSARARVIHALHYE